MLAYIYVSYLMDVDWSNFGMEEGNAGPFLAHIRRLEIPAALKMLDAFTFSESMLTQLDIYLFVGGPVTLAYMMLEIGRVRWLQTLLKERLSMPEAHRASRWLRMYLIAITVAFVAVLLLTWFHLGLPVAHYCIAGSGFFCGCMAICIYLAAPIDFQAIGEAAGAAGEIDLQRWAWRVQHRVRPVLKVVAALHLAAVAAGNWKIMSVGNDHAELLFGVLETAVVLGYQIFQAMFAVDDAMVGYSRLPTYNTLRRRSSVTLAALAAFAEQPVATGTRMQVRRTSLTEVCRDVLAEEKKAVPHTSPKLPQGQVESSSRGVSVASFLPSWRSGLRLSAASANIGMLAYIYIVYLAAVHWENFGSLVSTGAAPATASSVEDFEAMTENLSIFTFSHAMLNNLGLYLFVGLPVSAVYFFLERSRVRWLQSMLMERLPMSEASRPMRLLDLYLGAISAALCFVMLLVPFHLGRPKAHFVCAGSAFSCGFASICIHLTLPIDFAALGRSAAAAGDVKLVQWAQRTQQRVRPAMTFVLWLHVAAAAAMAWKATGLGDDSKALVFGIMETSVILGYQLCQAMLAIDDDMVAFPGAEIAIGKAATPMLIRRRRSSITGDKGSTATSLALPHLLGGQQQHRGKSRRGLRRSRGKHA